MDKNWLIKNENVKIDQQNIRGKIDQKMKMDKLTKKWKWTNWPKNENGKIDKNERGKIYHKMNRENRAK